MTGVRGQFGPPGMRKGAGRVLPLEAGAVMTRVEFERRWEAQPSLKCAELIDGVVHMNAATRADAHGDPHGIIVTWMGTYVALTPGVQVLAEPSIRLDADNMPQPDACLRIPERAGGQSHIDDEGYLCGAPEVVAEVAASSASYDLHGKKEVYRRHGVREYIVWRVLEEAVDYFILRDGRFDPHPAGEDGLHRSEVLPGLTLDAAALLRRDLAAVVKAVHDGCAGEEHKAFAQRVAKTEPRA